MNEQTIVALFEKAESILTKYGPDVSQAVLNVVRIDAAKGLIESLVILVCSIYFIKWGKIKSEAIKEEEGVKVVIIIVTLVVGGFFAFFSILCLIDLWKWIALFDPVLGLVHKAITKY